MAVVLSITGLTIQFIILKLYKPIMKRYWEIVKITAYVSFTIININTEEDNFYLCYFITGILLAYNFNNLITLMQIYNHMMIFVLIKTITNKFI